jgi:hypothetical protein
MTAISRETVAEDGRLDRVPRASVFSTSAAGLWADRGGGMLSALK